jgi:hypothetical protein
LVCERAVQYGAGMIVTESSERRLKSWMLGNTEGDDDENFRGVALLLPLDTLVAHGCNMMRWRLQWSRMTSLIHYADNVGSSMPFITGSLVYLGRLTPET